MFTLHCPLNYPAYKSDDDNFFVEAEYGLHAWCNALNEYLLDSDSVLTLGDILNKGLSLYSSADQANAAAAAASASSAFSSSSSSAAAAAAAASAASSSFFGANADNGDVDSDEDEDEDEEDDDDDQDVDMEDEDDDVSQSGWCQALLRHESRRREPIT